MATRLNPHRPPPAGFPSWPEFIAVSLIVVWLVGLVAVEPILWWMHTLLFLAFGILLFSFWNNRSPRGRS